MSVNPIVGGYIPDPVDVRDRPFGALGLEPVSFTGPHIIPRGRPVHVQGNQDCVANAGLKAVYTVADLLGIAMPELSRRKSYWGLRKRAGLYTRDVGGHIRDFFADLAALGVCAESACPYDPSLVLERPGLLAHEAAFDHRIIEGYYRLPDGDVDAVIRAIRANQPVVAGFDVGRPFVDYRGARGLAFNPPQRSIGRHALLLFGHIPDSHYEDGVFATESSWGEEWGDRGTALLTPAYIRSARDMWTVKMVKY